MAFIKTVSETDAQDELASMYQKDLETKGYVPNYTKVFSHRPDVMNAWASLNGTIKKNLDTRRYELVTLAAARALKSSYCMLAHGSILLDDYYDANQLSKIARDFDNSGLSEAEVVMMAYAEKIVKDASSITQQDIDKLKAHGFTDAEVFDIAATASVRCFFSKLLDALGAQPDSNYAKLDSTLRQTLTVGRAISE